jgi:HK97 family phage major capsid protein
MTDMTPGRKLVKLAVPKLRGPNAGPQPTADTADTTQRDVSSAIDGLNRAFEAFKAENDARLAALAKGRDDVVTTDKVDRINNEISELDRSVRAMSQQLAASAMLGGGSGNGGESAEDREYRAAFRGWMGGRVSDDAFRAKRAPSAAMTTFSDPDGGFLVSDPVVGAMSRVLGTVSAMRSLAEVISISSPVYKKPMNLGGATSGWVTETGSRANTSTPQLSELAFPTFEIYAQPAATQTLLDDAAIDVESWLGGEIAIVFSEQEGSAFISGDGVSKPRGITSYTNVANASYTWGKIGYTASGVAAALNDSSNKAYDSTISLIHSLKSGYRAAASFVMNDLTTAAYRKVKDANDNYIWQPANQVGQPSMLLGYPVVTDDNMADIGAGAYPVAFGDFRRGYVIVDRVGIRVLRDPYTSKPYVLFYTTKRVGGGVQDFAAIKLLKIAAS